MILYLDWPGFYHASRPTPTPAPAADAGPWALARERRILDADPEVLARGVARGMGAMEARAIVPELRPAKWDEAEWISARDGWLAVAAAASDRVLPGLPHEAWLDLAGHPEPGRVADETLVRLRSAGYGPWRAGLAPAAWVARAAACRRDPPALWTDLEGPLAVEDAAAFLADLDVELLEPVDPRHRERLRTLGYARVGEVRAAPMEALRMQFGRDAGAIAAAARGLADRPFRGAWPPDRLRRRLRFAGGLDDREAVRTALGALARRLAADLARRDAGAGEVRLVRVDGDGNEASTDHRFPRPVGRAAALALKLNQMVDTLPGEAVPHEIRVELGGLARGGAGAGRLAGMGGPGEREAALERAAADLRPRFGDGVIVPLGQVSVPRRERVLRAWREVYRWP